MMYPTQIIGYVDIKKKLTILREKGKRERGERQTDRQRRIDKEKEEEREKKFT